MNTITLRIKMRGEGLEGNQIRPAKLQDAIKAASITVQDIQHLDPDLLIECEPADEAAIRALVASHLATDWATLDAAEKARLDADEAEAVAVKADNQVLAFLNFSPAQLDAWVDANIPVGGQRTAFKILGRIALAAGRGKLLR